MSHIVTRAWGIALGMTWVVRFACAGSAGAITPAMRSPSPMPATPAPVAPPAMGTLPRINSTRPMMPTPASSQGMSNYGYSMPSSGQSGDQSTMQTNAGSYASTPQVTAPAVNAGTVLTASGVLHDNGRLSWPMGLQILAAPEAPPLRARIEALFQYAAVHAAAGTANANLAGEIRRAVDQLRGLLLKDKNERFAMPLALYERSEQFLDQLDRAGQALATGLQGSSQAPSLVSNQLTNSSASAVPLSTQTESLVSVGIRDNYFQPGTLTIPVNTTVAWVNQGRHHHTVTSADGTWGTGELAPGATYLHTFARAGSYPYFCSIHSTEMRGTIVVTAATRQQP